MPGALLLRVVALGWDILCPFRRAGRRALREGLGNRPGQGTYAGAACHARGQ